MTEDGQPAARRRPVVLAATIGVLLGGGVVGGIAFALSSGGGGGSSHVTAPATSTTSTTSAGPTTTLPDPADPGAKQLVHLLAAGGNLTFHATYQATGPQYHITVNLWRRPPLTRRDTDTVTSQGEIFTSQVQTVNGYVQCLKSGNSAWACTPTKVTPQTDPTDLTLGNASKFFANQTLAVTNETQEGQDAICFTGASPGAGGATVTNKICTTKDGIPVYIDTGQGPIELTGLDRTPVADNVFVPPAEPGATGTTSAGA